jgi:hypothetical protein
MLQDWVFCLDKGFGALHLLLTLFLFCYKGWAALPLLKFAAL